MKKILIAVLFGMVSVAQANVWTELKDQVWDQTKVTILKSGGVAGFYDFAPGSDFSLKSGVISHVLTNRFISGSLGWYSADNQSGVIVGGPTVKINEIFKTFFPDASELVGVLVPPLIKPFGVGFNYGFGTDKQNHYGFHLEYSFEK